MGVSLIDPAQEGEDSRGMLWGDEVLPQEVVILAHLMSVKVVSLAPLSPQCSHHEVWSGTEILEIITSTPSILG